jgi:hypothetical protein
MILHVTYSARSERIRIYLGPGGRSDMSKIAVIAKMRRDGRVVEVLPDGTERPFPDTPMRPMTELQDEAAAWRDPSRPRSSPGQNAFRGPERCGGRSG